MQVCMHASVQSAFNSQVLTPDTMESLVHGFVTSQLDNANSLLVAVSACHIEKLQWIQNMAACLIVGSRKYDRITPILKELHWLPVAECIKFKVLLLTFKVLYNVAPQCISSMPSVHKHTRMHCSNPTLRLFVPRKK